MPKENNNIEEILVNVHDKDNLYICIKDAADFQSQEDKNSDKDENQPLN